MDDLQIKAIALNAACVRFAGITDNKTGYDSSLFVIKTAKEFEKYLKGEKDE